MKKICVVLFTILLSLSLTSCFNYKNSPFYDSEWVMQNYDNNMQLYYHHLILYPDHKVMLRVSYADSTNIIVWNGTFKINSNTIKFNFTDCIRYEEGKPVGTYEATKFIKYYTGDYNYSIGLLPSEKSNDDKEDDENLVYHLALIRPRNYFYGDTIDIFGNQFEDFVKMK